MFISHNDFDKCLVKGSYIDKIVIISSNGKSPEQIMTSLNKKENNWRLCKAIRKGTMIQFILRTYFDKIKLDMNVYLDYFEKEIRPIIEGNNSLIKKKFPNIVFYE